MNKPWKWHANRILNYCPLILDCDNKHFFKSTLSFYNKDLCCLKYSWFRSCAEGHGGKESRSNKHWYYPKTYTQARMYAAVLKNKTGALWVYQQFHLSHSHYLGVSGVTSETLYCFSEICCETHLNVLVPFFLIVFFSLSVIPDMKQIFLP